MKLFKTILVVVLLAGPEGYLNLEVTMGVKTGVEVGDGKNR